MNSIDSVLQTNFMTKFPPGVKAQLFFLEDEGQFIFSWMGDNTLHSKMVSSEDIQAAFSEEVSRTIWIPNHVRAYGYGLTGKWFMACFNPKKITIIWDDRNFTYPVPPTILISSNGRHYLYAIKDANTIDKSTQLYCAPYLNVYSDGLICWGTNDFIESVPENATKIWDTFIRSTATHSNNDRVSHKYETLEILLDSLENKRKYPINDLVNIGVLGSRLKTITEE